MQSCLDAITCTLLRAMKCLSVCTYDATATEQAESSRIGDVEGRVREFLLAAYFLYCTPTCVTYRKQPKAVFAGEFYNMVITANIL
jgi:hypothetical protein